MMKIWIKGVVILNMLCRITFIFFPLNGAEIYRRFSLERWTCDMEVPHWAQLLEAWLASTSV